MKQSFGDTSVPKCNLGTRRSRIPNRERYGWTVTPPGVGLGPSTKAVTPLRALMTKVLLSPCFEHLTCGVSPLITTAPRDLRCG